MILLTGGAGFIGSNLHAALAARGERVVVSDWLGTADKWRNLSAHPPHAVILPEHLDAYLATNPAIDRVVHLGAISETTATDADLVWQTNVELSARLWTWCAHRGARFVYASSAATYGNGLHGFDDDMAALDTLAPLNLYGWSKHAFDLRVRAALRGGDKRPPQWAGLKFFNVYGPNEYHKGRMVSVVKTKHDELLAGLRPRLFRSDQPDIADGQQQRDFVYVDDVVEIILWLLDKPAVNGLFNVGTGIARTYEALVNAVCDAAGRPRAVEYIPMPEALHGQYQSFTEARMERLRTAGYTRPITPLEDGVRRYVQHFLGSGAPYR